MITYREMVDFWGGEGLLHFPLDRFAEYLRFDLATLPPEGATPADVPVLFTSYIEEGEAELFSLVELEIGDRAPMRLVVIGAVPDDQKLLYCLDCDTGSTVLLSLDPPALETTNSNCALFVEFLLRVERFVRADQGADRRVPAAAALHRELAALDPVAFADPESWWSVAFAQLEGKI